ncbi:MAG: hypothetical protein QXY76_06945 [Nitrososphaeria archaeon]
MFSSARILGHDKSFTGSKLTEEECLELGRKVNMSTLKMWKEKGWIK